MKHTALAAALSLISVITTIITGVGIAVARSHHHTGDVSGDQNAIGPLAPTTATISSCLVPGCDATQFIVAALDSATTEIRGQTYNFTDNSIVAALVRAKHDRHVDVAMLVDKTTPCERNSAVAALVAAGIPVSVDYKPRIAHNKVFIIDQKATIEGSFNFSANARHNAENTNLVQSPVVANWYRAQWGRRQSVSKIYQDRADFCKH